MRSRAASTRWIAPVMVARGAATFRGQRDQRGAVPQHRAVVDAAVLERRLRRHRLQCRGVDALGSDLVTEHAERGGKLRLRDRGGEIVELGVDEIAQVADRRRAVARQHIERIGEIASAVAAGVFGVGDEIAQPLHRQPERNVGHREVALARPGQEVGDVGIEPDVVAAHRPQAERAVRALARQQAVDRLLDALVDALVEREMRGAGEIVDIEQRQRAAGDLLGAPERITVERGQQRRRVERGRQADRDRHAAGSGHEVGEQVVRQRDALAARHGLHRAAGEDLRRRPAPRARSCVRARSRPAR